MTEVSGYSKRRCLLTGAVPTIFECWKDQKHIYKPTRTRPQNKMQINKTINLTKDDETPQAVEIYSECDTLSDVNKENVKPMIEIQTCEVELQNTYMIEHMKLLENKIACLEQRQLKLVTDNQALQDELNQSIFCVENLKPQEFPFYTGFQSLDVFNVVLELLNPGENGENISVVQEKENVVRDTEKKTRSRKLSPSNQFFLFLCRIKLGLFEMDLARRFNISVSTVSNIIISWANFCYLRLGTLNIWPSREMVDKSMPSSFKMKYPSTRAIIDCTEIKVNMPSSLLLKSQTYSNYKSTNTLKGLIGIAPCGSITFVSQLYHGSISDREMTIRSGFLDLPFNEGDSLMADKGFDIQDLLDEKQVRLNIPPFLGKYGQMTDIEVFQTQSIAAERIHVERAINKIKNFHIFDQAIPVSLFGTINQIWTVCALLTLFQEPIISCPGSD